MTEPTFDELVFEAKVPEARPEDGRIEDTLLTALLSGDPEAVARIIADTRPEDFHYGHCRELAGLVYPALSRGEYVDLTTVAAQLDDDYRNREDFLQYVEDFFTRAKEDPPSLGKVDAYLGIFAEVARLRLAKHMVKKADEALEEGLIDPQEAAARIFNQVAELEASRRLVGTFKSEADTWATYFDALEASQDPERDADFTGLDTGFTHLNRVLNGLGPALYALLGGPGTGKTTLAKQIADNVAMKNDNVAVIFISLEQSREELRLKTLARLSGIENRDIRRGRLDVTAEGWKKVKEASESFSQVADRYFLLEGDRNTTPDRIRLAALQVQRKTEAEAVLVVVDYLQIVPTEAEFQNTRNKVEHVVTELRRLARDLRSPVLVVSSVGRASYGKSGIAVGKETGGIEYTADATLVMVKDEDKTKGESTIDGVQRPWGRIHLDAQKNRMGELARIGFNYYKQIDRFVEGDKEVLPEED